MIEYIFQLDSGKTLNFRVNINREYSAKADRENHSFWTRLDYHRCSNCPLSPEKYKYCPTAVDLQEIIDVFSPFLSHLQVLVTVKTPERQYSKTCDLQTGLQSLLGLVMATSACPILSKLWPLANFHLPFATTEDTLFRTVGAYLIYQYFILAEGGKADFELMGLRTFYNSLEELNACFTDRIRIASRSDANLNAVVQLGALSFMVYVSLEEQLREFRRTFQKNLPKPL
ncbi:MAG: hypothetical protein BWK80_51100 [Desulfobacteraceae bacterium IS3]|nr:MAG: hypothetical protein BWK80_51100 [Desulfobacteraceae bacterium IS3]